MNAGVNAGVRAGEDAPFQAIDAEVRDRPMRIAVIGDYGNNTQAEADVAALVHSFAPDHVVTVGDNNYPLGSAATIDVNVGQYYHAYIRPYLGGFGAGAARNRFWPALGNHDWEGKGLRFPYVDFFALPGNERYYDVLLGDVHLFVVDSDGREPDGVSATSVQAQWLQAALASSTAPYRWIAFHHASHSSSSGHGSEPDLRWPYEAWGADLVLQGHDHVYERLTVGGIPYVVNGAGGAALYGFGQPLAGSESRFNQDFGALLAEVGPRSTLLRFITRGGVAIDTFTMPRDASLARPTATIVPAGSTWKFHDDGVFPGAAWNQASFDDASWSSGPAQLGYGDGDEATTVSFGADPTHKHVTTWFRHAFTLADPAAFDEYVLELVRDDGAIAFVNGVEVLRSNMKAGVINPTTLALSTVDGAAEDAWWSVEVPASALVAGTNVLAVEVHQSSKTSTDVSLDGRLIGVEHVPTLIGKGAIWRYLDAGGSPPAGWNRADFDDSSWSSGPAQLGYGDGDEATTVSFGADPTHKHVTTWFRHAFPVDGASATRALLCRTLYDDAFVIYVNGVEAARANLPWLGGDAATLAGFDRTGAEESRFVETSLDPALLVEGQNVIAVELHQSAPSSADLSFDLELARL